MTIGEETIRGLHSRWHRGSSRKGDIPDASADNVVLITADVSASTGKRTGQSVEFASRSTEGPTLQQASLSFHVESDGALTRR